MIGLVCGTGNFPKEIITNLNKIKKKFIIINLTKKKITKNDYILSIGQYGKFLKVLKQNNCKEIIFAGKIDRPQLMNIKFDKEGLKLLPQLVKIFKSGDYKILNFIINAFNRNKIKVISHTKYCKYITLYKNVTKAKPSLNNYRDLKVAIKLINSLNTNDLGQGIIVENHRVMMVECAFGTDVMLKNFEKQKIKKVYPILIKTTKKYRDLIIDLPTIGLETIKNSIKAGLKGIFVKKGKNVFLQRDKCIKLADKHNFFISVF